MAAIAAGVDEPATAGDADATWRAFVAVVEGGRHEVAGLLDRPIQTNEVGRSAALLGM